MYYQYDTPKMVYRSTIPGVNFDPETGEIFDDTLFEDKQEKD